jgi:guanylate kinase
MGKAFIVSAPSGAGKTTIVHRLLDMNFKLEFSISATSRPKRGEEINAKDYYFLSAEEFRKRIDNDEFLEWEEVYPDQFYGTLKSEVQRIWDKGNQVIFDVDVIGGLNLKKYFNEDALAMFIMPPNQAVLEERLRMRKTETEEKIQMRIAKAGQEISKAKEFDRVVVNDNLSHAVGDAKLHLLNFLKK